MTSVTSRTMNGPVPAWEMRPIESGEGASAKAEGKLGARAEALLQDMARDHGLRGLEFDKDGLIPIQIGGVQTAIAGGRAIDSFFMMSVIDGSRRWEGGRTLASLELCAGLAARRTRLAVEPKSGRWCWSASCSSPASIIGSWQGQSRAS